MPFKAAQVANYFLELAEKGGRQLTPMKLQKLVFFAHGWHLALAGQPLVNESVEAWQWGPVIPSLWGELKEFGNQPITRRITTVRILDRKPLKWKIIEDSLEQSGEEKAAVENAKELIERVWEAYGDISAVQLSNMTHEDGTPWHTVWMPMAAKPIKRKDIPNELIAEYFREQSAQ